MATILPWANLTIPPASTLNRVGAAAADRQLSVAGSRQVVPLVYGEDRIGARVLNVLKAADNTDLVVQCLWCFAGAAINDVLLNDQALPSAATITHYLGDQTAADPTLVDAFGAQGIAYTDTLAGYMYSVLRMPSGLFGGALKLTARVQGRRTFDPRGDRRVSRNYPLLAEDALRVSHAALGGSMQRAPGDDMAVQHTALGGALRQPLQAYNNWPIEALSVVHQAGGGVLTTVLRAYNDWPVEGLTTSHAAGGGVLDTVLLSYTNWPVEALAVTHEAQGGTLS